jgi:hypothetical protein
MAVVARHWRWKIRQPILVEHGLVWKIVGPMQQ